jgi:hypothetical protein
MQFILPNGTPQQAGLSPLAGAKVRISEQKTKYISVFSSFKVILSSGTGDFTIVDGVDGTMVIAGQTTGAAALMEPGRRRACDIVHRTDLGALSTTDAHIIIHHELAVCNHVFVEIATNDIRVESGSGAFLQLLDTTFAVSDDRNDMAQLMPGILNLPGFFLHGVCVHKRQTDVRLGHNHRKDCLSLQSYHAKFLVEDGHALTHIVATGRESPAEGIPPLVARKVQSPDEVAYNPWRLPSMRGKAESDTLTRLEYKPVTTLSDEIGNAEKWFIEGFCYLLSYPFCIACA